MPTPTIDPASTVRQAHLDPLPGIIDFASINLLAGASGVGKTCLTASLLTCFRDQRPIFGWQPNPVTKIGYLCLDRGWSSTRVWLERAGYPDIPHYSLTDDPDFNASRLYNKRARVGVLRWCIEKLDPIPGMLVAIDPIALFMGGNLNDYDSCAVALIEMRRLCQEFGITILGSAHASKQKNDKAEQYKRLQDRILGSAAQHGYGDTQMYLASPEECNTKFYQFLVHPHLTKAQVIRLNRDETTGLFLTGPVTSDAITPHERSVEEGTLLSAITDEAKGSGFGDLATLLTTVSRATLYRYLAQLVDEGAVEKLAHGRYRKVRAH